MAALAAIFGCAGPRLTEAERRFFAEADPWGFILFARNIDSPDQARRLTAQLRETVGRAAPILIDQEGGRVARLKPPHWPPRPPMRRIGALWEADPALAREFAWLDARLIAADLAELGIDVDCAPVLDVPAPRGHDIIGDRAFADAPDVVAELGRAFCDGLLAGGVLPVVKHIPGHGRAEADSHLALPVVHDAVAALDAVDFAPFRALADLPLAMTAHVAYAAIDGAAPATLSPAVIATAIRGRIGFSGALISDDLGMKALEGGFRARAERALRAGCDVALHCSGDMAEMEAVAAGCAPLAGDAARRCAAALARRRAPAPFDRAAGETRLAALLGDGVSA